MIAHTGNRTHSIGESMHNLLFSLAVIRILDALLVAILYGHFACAKKVAKFTSHTRHAEIECVTYLQQRRNRKYILPSIIPLSLSALPVTLAPNTHNIALMERTNIWRVCVSALLCYARRPIHAPYLFSYYTRVFFVPACAVLTLHTAQRQNAQNTIAICGRLFV